MIIYILGYRTKKPKIDCSHLGSWIEPNYLAPILNILVPQTGQTALTAGLPFFMVTLSNSVTSLLALHFTQ
ncbi:hypothetical protein A3K29_01940 [Candidatus Collierbacteria bacterium RIFOXYB2_FULL_46_14]|nr:MAG: hypothetical protein A3K29_01940 [Candidatus Collierbacteria bacterium RIFOXYB2_FULL_46_14]OGD75930.1 MAG: hypothetical protein A3K43_01940 [Candidatus Collierbacteria bacterium RIFOXYA2_FULL_46_20]OGD77266.1 MAG: hypothetical protein A3K39_01940 [Candidatus Collierbacteria bacterium RIFOXYC2_FULL_43_15]OGD80556.1 MAG: hypothetical protein A2320_02430 [Pseudomonadales bacterium GWC2_63_15]OGD81988.1 MAG: hypothetical protein A3K36_01940 [Candidatus Collierbacteria bacterium RIFOXYD2_FUL